MDENMPEKRTWYVCDPLKNTGCKKRSCVYHPRAQFRKCARTSDPACAMLDESGEPITWEAFDDYRMRLAVAYANKLAVQTPEEAPISDDMVNDVMSTQPHLCPPAETWLNPPDGTGG